MRLSFYQNGNAATASCMACWNMVRPAHFIFVMPPAVCGVLLSARGWPGWRVMLFMSLAMLGMWCAAMTYNRITDRDMDRANPRTAHRAMPTGAVPLPLAWVVCLCGALLFVASAAMLNTLCFMLAIPALALALGYSHTKYHTRHCHFVLGVVSGLTPLAGALAFSPQITLGPACMGLGLCFWVAGFDIIYACQDADFDRAYGVYSAPACLGAEKALRLAGICHVLTVFFLFLSGLIQSLGFAYFFSILVIAGILIQEQRLISANDLRRVRIAFLTCNGLVAAVLLGGVCAALFWT